MNKLDIEHRLTRAKKYISYLDYSLKNDWLMQFEEYDSGTLSFEQSVALIHPSHYQDCAGADIIRGKRSFSSEPSLSTFKCESRRIWGYECTVSIREYGRIEADHVFPYALGGPTIGGNKVHLCRLHNSSKGNDFHLFPWEQGTPKWLPDIISKIRRIINR
jgi:hypothetical protein